MKLSLLAQLHAAGIPEPELEVRFHPKRKWRFDMMWDRWLAVDVQGGGWVRGKHHRPKGYANDVEKLVEAQLMGIVVLWVTPEQIASGQALAWIERAFTLRRAENEAL